MEQETPQKVHLERILREAEDATRSNNNLGAADYRDLLILDKLVEFLSNQIFWGWCLLRNIAWRCHTLTLIEVDITNAEQAKTALSQAFGLEPTCWGHANHNYKKTTTTANVTTINAR